MFDQSLFQLIFWLIVAHAVADFPLQGEYLSQVKNRHSDLTQKMFRSGQGSLLWPWHLFCHAAIHGGAVAYITGNIWLGCAEIAAHSVIDFLKCEGKLGYSTDQWLHVACKVAWAVITVYALA